MQKFFLSRIDASINALIVPQISDKCVGPQVPSLDLYTENSSWSVSQHTFSREHTLRSSVAQDKVMSASFTVIPARRIPILCSLMSLLNVKFNPFPSLPILAQCFLIQGSNISSGPHKKLLSIPRRTPLAGGSSGRLTDSRPKTQVMSPTSPTSQITRIRSNNPLDIPDNNPDFPVLRRRHHDFRQCKRYAEFRSIKLQP